MSKKNRKRMRIVYESNGWRDPGVATVAFVINNPADMDKLRDAFRELLYISAQEPVTA